MFCPKCGHERKSLSEECLFCRKIKRVRLALVILLSILTIISIWLLFISPLLGVIVTLVSIILWTWSLDYLGIKKKK